MRVSVFELKQIWKNTEFCGISDKESFDKFDIVFIGEKFKDTDKVLFFATYAKDVEKEGWYEQEFDRHKKLPCNPNWVYVIEDNSAISEGLNYIKVPSINKALEALFRHILSQVNPFVCAITGSVGKTTAIAMLEDVISAKHKCYRIYAKRITPLVLFAKIINQLEIGTDYLVLEMAMYYKFHIKELVRLITPDISVMLNVRDNHFGVDGISSKKDILRAKSKIIAKNSIPILNVSDPNIRKLMPRKNNAIAFGNCTGIESKAAIKSLRNNFLYIQCGGDAITIKPFILTELCFDQVLAVLTVSSILKLDLQETACIINNFHTKENRIQKIELSGKEVFFEGDASCCGRIREFSKNFYPDSSLVISHLDFGRQELGRQIREIVKCFSGFSRVRINNEIILFNGKRFPKNVEFMPKEKLLENIPPESTIFYICANYFRRGMSLENLTGLP
ncbi:MAG: Mur ligase family protein [bacterium]